MDTFSLLHTPVEVTRETPVLKYDFPAVVDSSMLAERRVCPQSAEYKYIWKLIPPTLSPHLHAGKTLAGALHTARETFQQTASASAAELAGYYSLLTSYHGVTNVPNHPTKNLPGLIDAYLAYVSKWPFDQDHLQIKYAEANFAIPLRVRHPRTRDPILYAGRIDMLAEDTLGDTYVVDEKTTGRMDKELANKFLLRPQFIGYNYALRRHFRVKSHGTLVRIIVVNGSNIEPMEIHIPHSNEDLERWWRQVNFETAEWIQQFLRKEMPRHGDACYHWGRPCDYTTPCRAPYRSLENLAHNFVHNDWSPLNPTNIDPGDDI